MDYNNYITPTGGRRWGKGRTKALSCFLLFVSSAVLPSCSLLHQREKIVIKTETVTEYRDSTVWRDTTIFVPIPLESDQAIVHVGDTSHRETTVAESDAWIGSDGMLHHSLWNKSKEKIPHSLKLPQRWLYTGVTNTKEDAHVIIKDVRVEKSLSWWQKVRLRAFWWLLGCVLVLLAITFRKPLMRCLGLRLR